MKKNILLTFDYELFLGSRSGSVGKCMLEPTSRLLEILNKFNAKGVFFIDTTFINHLKKEAESHETCVIDLKLIEEQLIRIAQDGHYVYHHLHPHWLDAKYIPETNQWDLSNNRRFGFNNITQEEREKIFSFSNQFLQSVYDKAGILKSPDGYRAGGLFIEPIANFIPFFQKYNVLHEFSVLPGEFKTGEKLFYDFREAPQRPYSFMDQVYKENIGGEFHEYPISRIRIMGFMKILNGVYYRLFKSNNNKIYGDGSSVSNEINSTENKGRGKINEKLVLDIPLSAEFLNPVSGIETYKLIKKKDYIHFLSHPKLLSPVALKELSKLLNKVNSKFDIEYDFKKFEL